MLSTFVYNDAGLVVDYTCKHDMPSQDCADDICCEVGRNMVQWYRALPAQGRVRVGKRDALNDPDLTPNYARILKE